MFTFYSEGLLSHHPAPKLENQSLSTILVFVFNIFAANICRPSPSAASGWAMLLWQVMSRKPIYVYRNSFLRVIPNLNISATFIMMWSLSCFKVSAQLVFDICLHRFVITKVYGLWEVVIVTGLKHHTMKTCWRVKVMMFSQQWSFI